MVGAEFVADICCVSEPIVIITAFQLTSCLCSGVTNILYGDARNLGLSSYSFAHFTYIISLATKSSDKKRSR